MRRTITQAPTGVVMREIDAVEDGSFGSRPAY
jgi:hypothetical protein